MSLREQVKSVAAFPSNPIRTRILAREIERSILDVYPAPTGKYCRLQHVTRWVELNEDPSAYKGGDTDEIPSLRRPFSRWLKGTALPSIATRVRLDRLFKDKLGTKWCGRSVDSPEQTLLAALDLIGRNSTPNNQETLAEAETILEAVNSAVRGFIPKIANLERNKFTTYNGGKALSLSVSRKSNRYSKWSKRKPIAQLCIVERISSYDSISPLCALLMYLVKPNNKTIIEDDLSEQLLLDFISGVAAAYMFMLHRYPREFQTGGLVVDLYRLVYWLFLVPNTSNDARDYKPMREVFYNHFPEFSIDEYELKARFSHLNKLFDNFTNRAGLNSTEFMGLIDPVNPDRSTDIQKWWAGN